MTGADASSAPTADDTAPPAKRLRVDTDAQPATHIAASSSEASVIPGHSPAAELVLVVCNANDYRLGSPKRSDGARHTGPGAASDAAVVGRLVGRQGAERWRCNASAAGRVPPARCCCSQQAWCAGTSRGVTYTAPQTAEANCRAPHCPICRGHMVTQPADRR